MRSYSDIANELNCSRNNICIIMKSAINKIFRGLYKTYLNTQDISYFDIFIMMSEFLNLKTVDDMKYVYEILEPKFQILVKNDLQEKFFI